MGRLSARYFGGGNREVDGGKQGVHGMGETATLDAVIEKGLEYLRKKIHIEAAYLFGSQLSGGTHEHSDIDLAVFSPDVDGMDFFQRIRAQSDVAVNCDRRLELHLYTSKALANARPTNFAGYILAHG